MNMNFMAAASSREDIWTRTMDFLNMPDWLKLEMVQSVGAKILHVVIWLVVSWILLKLLCQVLRKITALKMSPQASRLTVKIVKEAGYIIIGVEAFALMGSTSSPCWARPASSAWRGRLRLPDFPVQHHQRPLPGGGKANQPGGHD